MQKQLGKETEDFKAFGMLWKLYQAYYIPEDNNAYWDSFINDGNNMIRDFPDVPIVRAFVTAYQNVLEHKLKEQK